MDKYIQECRNLGYLVERESGPNVTITPKGVKYLEDEGIIE
jgi:predicted transcriptional regulator